MEKAGAIAVSLFFLLGVLAIAPCWAVCFFQCLKWLHRAEREIRPEVKLTDSRPFLLSMLGRTAMLAQPEMLTEQGLVAREATVLWLRRLLLASAAIVVLVALWEFRRGGV